MKDYLYRFIQEDQKDFFSKALKGFLWAMSFIYLGLSQATRLLYQLNILRTKTLSCPVISIGNLTLGGTGKTPLTGFIAARLEAKGYQPAILTRGYMAKNGISDEVELYREMLPQIHVGQDRNRFAAGQKILGEHPQTNIFLMDDGFQHWRLHRHLDIVVIDATNPFGNGFLIPRGTLREPLQALRRADIIVLTKVDLAKKNLSSLYATLRTNNFHAIFVEAVYEPVKLVNLKDPLKEKELSFLKEIDFALFSAIGNPEGFERTVRALGAEARKTFAFPDHHMYTKSDLEHMIHRAQEENIKTFITTQKDGVKLLGLVDLFAHDIEFFTLAISVKIIKGEEELEERIDAVLRH